MPLLYDPYIDLEEQAAWLPTGTGLPTYGYLMRVLGERSIDVWDDAEGVTHPKLTPDERAVQCAAWARHYAPLAPQLADDLTAAARQFAALVPTTA